MKISNSFMELMGSPYRLQLKSLRCLAVEVQLDHIAEVPRQAPVLGLRSSTQLFNEIPRERNRLPLFHWLILLVHTEIIRLASEYLCNLRIPYTNL